jgi:diguanylate cyclase (GGDEF)-like protein/PAS domain S-box-containing protein
MVDDPMTEPIDPRLLRLAVAASHDGIVIADARQEDQPLIYVNPGFERMTGYRPDEVLGRNCRFLQGDDRSQPGLEVLRSALKAEVPCVVTVRNTRKDGSRFWNELSISPVRDDSGTVTHYIGIQKDISRRVEAETELERKKQELEDANRKLTELAIRDGLTGVFNRRHFDLELEREWRAAARQGAPLTLYMIDIDHFKQYNDRHGHHAGDHCLAQVARTILVAFQRATDIVARYGGEEFVVLSVGHAQDETTSAAERLRLAVRRLPLEQEPSFLRSTVTVSVGVASRIPAPGSSPHELLKEADTALYRAKAQGRDRVVVASPT